MKDQRARVANGLDSRSAKVAQGWVELLQVEVPGQLVWSPGGGTEITTQDKRGIASSTYLGTPKACRLGPVQKKHI